LHEHDDILSIVKRDTTSEESLVGLEVMALVDNGLFDTFY